MSKSDKPASEAARDGLTTSSVFDFLYHDARRVGSFLSQLDESGLLTGTKETENVEKSVGTDVGGSLAGNFAVAKAGASVTEKVNQVAKEALERSYDPFWANAIALINMLDERNLICDGLTNARVGQIVKISGHLTMADMSTWHGLWKEPALRDGILASANSATASTGLVGKAAYDAKKASQGQATMSKAALGILNILPHFVQTLITDPDYNQVWASTPEQNVVGSAAEIIFKFGSVIPGKWTAVGVLDALPDSFIVSETHGAPLGPNALVAAMAEGLIPPIKALLGRPATAYGMTPLVIFREVSSAANR